MKILSPLKTIGYILIAVLLVWAFVALFTKEDEKIYVPQDNYEQNWDVDVPASKYK